MKIQIEIDKKAMRNVTTFVSKSSDDKEREEMLSALKTIKESKEPFLLDTSLFEEDEGDFHMALIAVLMKQLMINK